MCPDFNLCYVLFLVCVMCSSVFVLCTLLSLCYVQCFVCVMCNLLIVLWQFAVMTLVASLQACLASLGRASACMHICETGQSQSWCAGFLGRAFVETTNEIPPYIYIHIYIYIYIYILYMYMYGRVDFVSVDYIYANHPPG